MRPTRCCCPATKKRLPRSFDICADHSIAVVPFGGGTSVVGGLDPIRGDFKAVVSLDLRRLTQLHSLDEVSGEAELGAGLTGPEAERLLGERGYSLGHFPQSFQFATIGGFAATRSSGQDSAGYGRFNDMVRGLRTVTPAGVLDLGRAPASAAGPDLRQLLIGSEGVFGVITRVRVRVHPVPAATRYEAWSFPDFATGADALRAVVQTGTGPTVVRLSDEAETGVNLATTESIGEEPITGGCLAITVFEGTEAHVESRHAETRALLEASGGTSLGEAPARGWEHGRYSAPYLRDSLLSAGALCETLETATNWSNVPALKAAVTEALTNLARRIGHARACAVPHFACVSDRRIAVLHRRRRAARQSDRTVAQGEDRRVGRDDAHRWHHHPSPRGGRRSPAVDARRGRRPRRRGAAGRQGHARPGGNPQPRQADSVTNARSAASPMLTNPLSGHGNAPHAAERADRTVPAARRGRVAKSSAPTPSTRGDSSTRRSRAAPMRWWWCGGDGVISMALQSLARGDIPLGIIPAGTGNDHAREFVASHKRSRGGGRRRRRRLDRDGRPRPHRRRTPARRSGSAPSWRPVSTHWSATARTACAGRTAGCATTSRWSPSCLSCGCCPSG